MPFDPTKPATNSLGSSAEMRAQLIALYDAINALNTTLSAALAAAIAGTANNTNSVSTLGLIVSNPPQQFEVQAIADKLDELINTERR